MAHETEGIRPIPPHEFIRSTLHRHFQSQLGLCAALENIADLLPDNVNEHKCMLAAQSISSIVRSAHLFEEDVLFPALQKRQQDGENLRDNLERLRAEHCEDESFGDEVADALFELAKGELQNVDKLSYMLRGFFEGLRRHIAFEKEHLLPLLSDRNE